MKNNTNTKGMGDKAPLLFRPGQVFLSQKVRGLLEENKLKMREVITFLGRHLSGDWGEMCPDDKRQNEDALKNGARIFSAYRSMAGDRFWVITEAKNLEERRESTTVLLPEEY